MTVSCCQKRRLYTRLRISVFPDLRLPVRKQLGWRERATSSPALNNFWTSDSLEKNSSSGRTFKIRDRCVALATGVWERSLVDSTMLYFTGFTGPQETGNKL